MSAVYVHSSVNGICLHFNNAYLLQKRQDHSGVWGGEGARTPVCFIPSADPLVTDTSTATAPMTR